jgi:hypothetical protein
MRIAPYMINADFYEVLSGDEWEQWALSMNARPVSFVARLLPGNSAHDALLCGRESLYEGERSSGQEQHQEWESWFERPAWMMGCDYSIYLLQFLHDSKTRLKRCFEGDGAPQSSKYPGYQYPASQVELGRHTVCIVSQRLAQSLPTG